jgi:pantothenate kinase-related protein Tda10
MYDESGHEIQRGDRAVATKTLNGQTRIYEGKVIGLRPRHPQVLIRVIKTGVPLWFHASCVAVQLSDEAAQ